jgi:hypothetical protein
MGHLRDDSATMAGRWGSKDIGTLTGVLWSGRVNLSISSQFPIIGSHWFNRSDSLRIRASGFEGLCGYTMCKHSGLTHLQERGECLLTSVDSDILNHSLLRRASSFGASVLVSDYDEFVYPLGAAIHEQFNNRSADTACKGSLSRSL